MNQRHASRIVDAHTSEFEVIFEPYPVNGNPDHLGRAQLRVRRDFKAGTLDLESIFTAPGFVAARKVPLSLDATSAEALMAFLKPAPPADNAGDKAGDKA